MKWTRLALWAAVPVAFFATIPVVHAAPPPATQTGAATTQASAQASYIQAEAEYDEKHFDAALKDVNIALSLDPNNEDAKILKGLIDKRLSAATQESPTTGTAENPSGTDTDANAFALFSPDQITRIKFVEFSGNERMDGSFPRKSLEDFWNKVVLRDPNEPAHSPEDANAFYSGTFGNQVNKIRAENAVAYYDKVKIQNDPADIKQYRTDVQPFILKNCATSGCHGQVNFQGFKLYGNGTRLPNTVETYTNFYILTHFPTKDGKLVNRATPEDSLVLQYLLPAADARFAHPGPMGQTIRLRDVNDANYMKIVNWIKTLAFPDPDYGIKYNMKSPASASSGAGPATTQAAGQ